jgi:hypothetical protein
MELRERWKGKENDQRSINNIVKHNICEGRGYKDIYRKLIGKMGSGR